MEGLVLYNLPYVYNNIFLLFIENGQPGLSPRLSTQFNLINYERKKNSMNTYYIVFTSDKVPVPVNVALNVAFSPADAVTSSEVI